MFVQYPRRLKAFHFDNFDNSHNSFLSPGHQIISLIIYVKVRSHTSGFHIRLVFTLPPRNSILSTKDLWNNFPCIITLVSTWTEFHNTDGRLETAVICKHCYTHFKLKSEKDFFSTLFIISSRKSLTIHSILCVFQQLIFFHFQTFLTIILFCLAGEKIFAGVEDPYGFNPLPTAKEYISQVLPPVYLVFC